MAQYRVLKSVVVAKGERASWYRAGSVAEIDPALAGDLVAAGRLALVDEPKTKRAKSDPVGEVTGGAD